MQSIFYYLRRPTIALDRLLIRYGGWLPDKQYLDCRFFLKLGYKLNLKNPKTFSEKLQWLKLYDRKPEYTRMVDKYEAKKYVSEIIGADFIIPTLGVWDKVEDIEWEKLPDRFVLKCTHDSGGLVICKNKSTFDKQMALFKLRKSLRNDYYKSGREWPYKNVKPRIIAEEYLDPKPSTNDLPDYKFFCFNGVPKYCQVISGRGTKMCIDFYDKAWNHQPFHEPQIYPFAPDKQERPQRFDLMWELAAKLSENKSFSRIDFYEVRGKVYFGEITFFPTSGMGGFMPKEYDEVFGDLLSLPIR